MKKNKNFYMRIVPPLSRPVRFFQRIKGVGIEKIPKEKNFIICSNHIAAKDVIMIGSVFPRQIRFVAKKELFKVPIIGWLIKKLGAIALDRGGRDIGAIKKSVELLKGGDIVALFPKPQTRTGRRSLLIMQNATFYLCILKPKILNTDF